MTDRQIETHSQTDGVTDREIDRQRYREKKQYRKNSNIIRTPNFDGRTMGKC